MTKEPANKVNNLPEPNLFLLSVPSQYHPWLEAQTISANQILELIKIVKLVPKRKKNHYLFSYLATDSPVFYGSY